MSEMRTEMMYIKWDEEDPEKWDYVSAEEADGMAIVFTATHPTEKNDVGSPVEYGLMVLSEEMFGLADIPEYIVNGGVQALKDAGCLVDDD